MPRILIALVILLAGMGCRSGETEAPAPEPPPAAAVPGPAAPIVVANAGLQTPESAQYDPASDVYLVSNINGGPADADGNGFISRVSPDGQVAELKWIDGLDAPKGMALSGGVLYVADITSLKMFDLATGRATGKVTIPGATFLNDVALAPDGTIYVSDSGLKAGASGLEPNGTDALYRMAPGATEATPVLQDKGLGNPNGLLADDEGVWVVTFGSGELYRVSRDGKKEQGQALPEGQLDGMVRLPDGSLLVSSWQGSSILRGSPGSAFREEIAGVASPADIGYDAKRNRVLVPLFMGNAVEIRALTP